MWQKSQTDQIKKGRDAKLDGEGSREGKFP